MTRRWLRLAFYFSLAPGVLLAQALAVDVEAGVSSTQLTTPDDYWGSRTGWLVGASGSFSITPWLALQAGIRVHEKGAAVPGSFEMRLSYLEFPLLARVAIGPARWPVRPLFAAGFAPARELSCAGRAVPPSIPEAPPPPMRPEDCISQRTDLWDFGLIAGVGVELRLGSLRTALLGQYTNGRHNIASGYPGGFPIHNRAMAVVASASLPIWPGRPSN